MLQVYDHIVAHKGIVRLFLENNFLTEFPDNMKNMTVSFATWFSRAVKSSMFRGTISRCLVQGERDAPVLIHRPCIACTHQTIQTTVARTAESHGTMAWVQSDQISRRGPVSIKRGILQHQQHRESHARPMLHPMFHMTNDEEPDQAAVKRLAARAPLAFLSLDANRLQKLPTSFGYAEINCTLRLNYAQWK